MNDYNLAGLSTRSFEQLIQALALRVIGPGVTIFGDGSDGGREATFDGLMSYPTLEKGWNGYLVIQAKFKQRPQNSKADGDWAIEQLRQELQQYANPEIDRECPEYYIFATNVVLTPALKRGSKDRAARVFKEFSKTVPLKGYAIWDYDQIRAFLDDAEDIRRSYAAWVTPGDVLSQVIDWIKPNQPNFKQILTNFLQKELQSDQYVNLEQAGHAIEDKIPIARVFIDTPAFEQSTSDPPKEDPGALKAGFVSELLLAAAERLNPETQERKNVLVAPSWDVRRVPQRGRYVLIGGPGQGKTTFAQFICQMFRAAILKDKVSSLAPETSQALAVIQAQCTTESLPLPTARRFPLRIVLSEFAAALARRETNSLLSYIIDRIRKRTDQVISAEDFRAWLGAYPWLLILDGLDEVPSSSNRDEVLSAISDFWVDVNDSNADILVLATTRPQGYGQDFSPELYRHYWLAPLSTPRALHYAQRLVEARYGSDQDRCEKILTRLTSASSNEATVRLMRSPLQVTIMAALVDKVGKPPQERWTLFRDYYKVIYDREVERDIPAAEILRNYKPDVDTIHHRVGLLLQIEGEKSGSTDARLSRDRTSEIIRDRLVDEEHSDEEVRELQTKITKAAAERLVFLAGLEADRVGFEIRSFQEFMAAECLMDGDDKAIRERLREIAPVAYWRNVFLFAAGKCFAERQHLRDVILAICEELNEDPDDEALRVTLMGSQLALDLLEDGPARRQPKYAQALARNALRLLSFQPGDYQMRLANVHESGLNNVYENEIKSRLALSDFRHTLGAWVCLSNLSSIEAPWAEHLLKSSLPEQRDEKIHLLQAPKVKLDRELFNRVMRSIPLISPSEIKQLHIRQMQGALDGSASSNMFYVDPIISAMVSCNESSAIDRTFDVPLRFENDGGFSIELGCYTFEPANYPGAELAQLTEFHPDWAPYIGAAWFLEKPSKKRLAKALRLVAESGVVPCSEYLRIPWPLGACLADVKSKKELLEVADRAEAGLLGDVNDWRKAESRWYETGIDEDDFYYAAEHWPFDQHIGTHGFAFTNSGITYEGLTTRELSTVRQIYERIEQPTIRAILADIFYIFVQDIPLENDDLQFWRRVIDDACEWFDPHMLLNIDEVTLMSDEFVVFLDQIGKTAQLDGPRPQLSSRDASLIAHRFVSNPSLTGLLRMFALHSSDLSLIPSSLLDPDSYHDPRIKEAAVLVTLAQKNLTVDEQRLLARPIVSLVRGRVDSAAPPLEVASTIGRIILIVKTYRTEDSSIEPFLLELRRNLAAVDLVQESRIIDALIQTLRLRLSGLRNTQIWSRLNLPEGLGRILRA